MSRVQSMIGVSIRKALWGTQRWSKTGLIFLTTHYLTIRLKYQVSTTFHTGNEKWHG